jgi:hypothetical protein
LFHSDGLAGRGQCPRLRAVFISSLSGFAGLKRSLVRILANECDGIHPDPIVRVRDIALLAEAVVLEVPLAVDCDDRERARKVRRAFIFRRGAHGGWMMW